MEQKEGASNDQATPGSFSPTEEESRSLQIADLHARFSQLRRRLEVKACEDMEHELGSAKSSIKKLQNEIVNQQQLLQRTRTELKARLAEVVAERHALKAQLQQTQQLLTVAQQNENYLAKELERKEREAKQRMAKATAAIKQAAEEEWNAKFEEVQRLAAEAMEQFQKKLTKEVVQYEIRMNAQLDHKEQELKAARQQIAELEQQLQIPNSPTPSNLDQVTYEVQHAAVPPLDIPDGLRTISLSSPGSESSPTAGLDAWSTVSLNCSISLRGEEEQHTKDVLPRSADTPRSADIPRSPKLPSTVTPAAPPNSPQVAVGPSVDQSFEFYTISPFITTVHCSKEEDTPEDHSTDPGTPRLHDVEDDNDTEDQGDGSTAQPDAVQHDPHQVVKRTPSWLASFSPTKLREQLDTKDQHHEDEQQAALKQQKQEEETQLLNSLTQTLGFYNGQSVAAERILQFCDNWDLLHAGHSLVFQQLIWLVSGHVKDPSTPAEVRAYWLTSLSTVLVALQKTQRHHANGSPIKVLDGAVARLPSFLTLRPRAEGDDAKEDGSNSRSAGWFKRQIQQQMSALIGSLQQQTMVALVPALHTCMLGEQERNTATIPEVENATDGGKGGESWKKITTILGELMAVLKANHAGHVLRNALFKRLFSAINTHAFNELLMTAACSTFSQGQNIQAGLAMLQAWIEEDGDVTLRDVLDEMREVYQAAHFLVLANKANKTLEEIQYWCPDLSLHHLYQLAKAYADNHQGGDSVAEHVLQHMKDILTTQGNEDLAALDLLPENSVSDVDVAGLLDSEDGQTDSTEEAHTPVGQGVSAFWARSRTNVQNIMSAMQIPGVFSQAV